MSKTNFNDLLTKSDVPVLVDFYADWCGPCKMMAPELEKVADELQGKVKILKVNVDRNPQAAAAYGIRGIPTLILFDKGEILSRQSGAMMAPQLKHFLQPHVQ